MLKKNVKLRNSTEIICDMLEASKNETVKTRIMYKSSLTHSQLKRYLSVLIENNLLKYSDKNKTYKTTEIGLNFLKVYDIIVKGN